MAEFDKPSLIYGISEQSATIASPLSCKDMVNFIPSPVHGLRRSPPMDRVYTEAFAAKVRDIVQNPITANPIQFNLTDLILTDVTTGANIPLTVSADATAYLVGVDRNNLKQSTIGDYLAIWDDTKVVTTIASTVPLTLQTWVFINTINPGVQYRIFVDGVQKAFFDVGTSTKQGQIAAAWVTTLAALYPAGLLRALVLY